MLLDELKIWCLKGWDIGGDEERFLQHKRFGYKARPRFPGNHIRRRHIGGDLLGKRQDAYALAARITRRHPLVIASRQDDLYGHARAKQALDSPISYDRTLRASLQEDGNYSGIETEGRKRFASFACRD